MIANIAKHFELQESSITTKALRRTRRLMILSLPVLPITIIYDFFGAPDGVVLNLICVALLVVGIIGLLSFAFSRFVNRFWFPDKYLDEWEIRIKHKSMVFAMQWTLYTMMALAIVFMFVGGGNSYVLKDFTTAKLGLIFTTLLLGLIYIQSFKVLSLVQPMDEDEFEEPIANAPWYTSKLLWGATAFMAVLIAATAPYLVSKYQEGYIYGHSKASCENKGLVLDKVGETKEDYTCKAPDDSPDNSAAE